jgi:hypothetical protein
MGSNLYSGQLGINTVTTLPADTVPQAVELERQTIMALHINLRGAIMTAGGTP